MAMGHGEAPSLFDGSDLLVVRRGFGLGGLGVHGIQPPQGRGSQTGLTISQTDPKHDAKYYRRSPEALELYGQLLELEEGVLTAILEHD